MWAVASAVIVPDVEDQPALSLESAKRKTSSFSEDSSKRPRLDTEPSYERTEPSHPSKAPDRLSDRRRSGQLEERKRGQRLFGALLGTLSQSSSSTAQKRRTDIEKKQQAKLKLQAEEYDEQKKQRLDSLMAVRRKEQKKYDKQSMHIRHSNMLAQAHFLQTEATPKLYYKPWELLPSEEDKIKSQVDTTEDIIQQELEQFDSESAREITESQQAAEAPPPEPTVEPEKATENANETVGPETNAPQPANGPTDDGVPDTKSVASSPAPKPDAMDQQENTKDHEDDGGEMMEADEDMIISMVNQREEFEQPSSWGGAIVYRIALWYPELVTHIFSVCTSYTPPSKKYSPIEDIVGSGRVPNFGYQIQLASGRLNDTIQSKEQIKQLLNSLYGGTTPGGSPGFNVRDGIHLDKLPHLSRTKLMSEEMLDFYADQYARNGIHGTSTKDEALPPGMSRSMDKYIPHLTRKSVNTHHWALWEKPEATNQIIREWLESVPLRHKSHL
ncbi:MAG: hypothetical protein Q9222_005309 [Ikaeria aurantiellina]